MKTLSLIGTTFLFGLTSCASPLTDSSGATPTAAPDEPGRISNAESKATPTLAADLVSLREEEKLARDVYLRLGERWELPIFRNIAGAEQRHMDQVREQLVAHDIGDPVTTNDIGIYSDPKFTKLYNELVAKGSTSLVDALRVGATIEDLDIKDLQDMAERTRDTGVLATYQRLTCGSRNHMRAFTAQLETQNATYTPQFIGAEDYAQILASSHERCGRAMARGQRGYGSGKARGHGRGEGRGQGRRAGSRGGQGQL